MQGEGMKLEPRIFSSLPVGAIFHYKDSICWKDGLCTYALVEFCEWHCHSIQSARDFIGDLPMSENEQVSAEVVEIRLA